MTDMWKMPLPKLIDRVDIEWSHYIRMRDSSVQMDGSRCGECFTCGNMITVKDAQGKWQSSAQCGHFITRGNLPTRFLDENTHLQCEFCNTVWDKQEMQQAYEDALLERYGVNTLNILNDLKNKHGLAKYGRAQIIDAYDYARKGISDMLVL